MKTIARAVTAAILVASALPGAAMAASTLNVKTWYNIPGYAYAPTEQTINQEVAYTSGTTPNAVQTLTFDPANYSVGVGGSTAMDFSGYLNVATAGTYTFFVNADDAGRVSIDGTSIVENAFYGNGSLNNPQTASIYLTAGSHAYDAFTFQLGGGQYFNATITGTAGQTGLSFSTTAAVPEPASWAMFIGGFGLIGGVMRRRNVAVSFA